MVALYLRQVMNYYLAQGCVQLMDIRSLPQKYVSFKNPWLSKLSKTLLRIARASACKGRGQKIYAQVGCPDRKCLNSGEAGRFIADCTQSTQTAAQHTSHQQSTEQESSDTAWDENVGSSNTGWKDCCSNVGSILVGGERRKSVYHDIDIAISYINASLKASVGLASHVHAETMVLWMIY